MTLEEIALNLTLSAIEHEYITKVGAINKIDYNTNNAKVIADCYRILYNTVCDCHSSNKD